MPLDRVKITEQPEIKKLDRGGYSIRFRIPAHHGEKSKKSKWKKCPVSKKGELGRYIEEYREELEESINDYHTVEDITLGEYARRWHEDREGTGELNALSWKREGQHIDDIANSCIANIPLKDLTSEDIDAFKAEAAKKKWSVDKQSRVLKKLKQIVTFANKRRKIKNDVGATVDNIKVVKEKRRALSEEQIADLIECLEVEPQTGKTAVIRLAIGAGLRRGECLGLQWGDIDLKKRTLTIARQLNSDKKLVIPKNNSAGVIPIDQDTKDWLRRWKKETSKIWYEGGHVPDDSPVCRNENGEYMRPSNFDRWRRVWFVDHGLGTFDIDTTYRDKNGIKRHRREGYNGYKLHELRHTAASDLVMSGADVISVQAYMRHKNLSTTEGYFHARDEGMKRAIEGLGQARREKIIGKVEKPQRLIGTQMPHDPKEPKTKKQKPLKKIIEEKKK